MDIVIKNFTVQATVPIFWCNLASVRPYLLLARQAIDELRVSHPDSTPSNVRSVYMSPWKSHQHNEKLAPICNHVIQVAKQASVEYFNTDLQKLNFDLRVTDCWGAIYEENDHTIAHNHFPSDFSAVIYLEAQADCSPIIFADSLSIQPVPETLILFPGMLNHSVPLNTGARRVVLAMNLQKIPSFPNPT